MLEVIVDFEMANISGGDKSRLRRGEVICILVGFLRVETDLDPLFILRLAFRWTHPRQTSYVAGTEDVGPWNHTELPNPLRSGVGSFFF